MAYDKSYPLFLVTTAYTSSPPHQLLFFSMWNASKSFHICKKKTNPKSSPEWNNLNIWQPDTEKNNHFSHSTDQVKHQIVRIWFAAIVEIGKYQS